MLRKVATVMKGTALGQALGLLVLPLLSRLYSPADFGLFQMYQSAMLVLVVFVSFRFEVALLRASNQRELQATLALCIISTIINAFLISVAWFFLVQFEPDIYKAFAVPPAIVFFAVLLIGTFQFLGFLVTREELYSEIGNSKVVQASSYSLIASALGIFALSAGMIIADIAGRLFGSIWSFRSLKVGTFSGLSDIAKGDLLKAAVKFREFPLIAVFGGIINSLGAILTPVLIYAKFSPEISGQFSLVERTISLPLAMLVTSISQVFMADFSRLVREDPAQLAPLFRRLVRNLVVMALVPAVILFVICPPLYRIVFGSEWALAGQLAQLMIPAYALIFVIGGVNMTLMLLGRQVLQTVWEIARLACMVMLWTFFIQPNMKIQNVILLHSLVLGGVALLFLAMAEYGIRKGPTEAALKNG